MLSQVLSDWNSESEADTWLMNNLTVILMETDIIEAPTSIPFISVVISPACERWGLFDCTKHHQCKKQIENIDPAIEWYTDGTTHAYCATFRLWDIPHVTCWPVKDMPIVWHTVQDTIRVMWWCEMHQSRDVLTVWDISIVWPTDGARLAY